MKDTSRTSKWLEKDTHSSPVSYKWLKQDTHSSPLTVLRQAMGVFLKSFRGKWPWDIGCLLYQAKQYMELGLWEQCKHSSKSRANGAGLITHLSLVKMAAIVADNIFKCIFLNENDKIPIQISLKLLPRYPIDNKPALVPVMAWRRTGDKPLPEPMMNHFTDVSRGRWVNDVVGHTKQHWWSDVISGESVDE